MADIDYDDYGASPRITGGQVQKLVQVAGAVCSLALIAGLALWGYRLAVRDVTGIPVVRAIEGPMRVAPANPGGNVADHQGMAINAVAAAGGAAEMPSEIVLAPVPMGLSEEDLPGLALATIAAPAPEPAAPVLPLADQGPAGPTVLSDAPTQLILPADPAPVDIPPTDAPLSTEDAVAMALAEALSDSLGSLDPSAPSAQVADPTAPVVRSLRPRARPDSAFAAPAEASAAVVSPFGETEIDPATLAVGTRLVQLGAFDSPEVARGEWASLRTRFGDLMSGKTLVIQSAQSGGRTFYRLRAHGFGGEDDARRFCAALLAENAACIPVAHR